MVNIWEEEELLKLKDKLGHKIKWMQTSDDQMQTGN